MYVWSFATGLFRSESINSGVDIIFVTSDRLDRILLHLIKTFLFGTSESVTVTQITDLTQACSVV